MFIKSSKKLRNIYVKFNLKMLYGDKQSLQKLKKNDSLDSAYEVFFEF